VNGVRSARRSGLGRSRLVADGQREDTYGHSCDDGDGRRECNADPHGTSLRRARVGARLCSVGAGSGHCIRAPNGERAGIVRSGMVAAGCAAGCVKARGVVLGVSSLCRVQPRSCEQGCRDSDRSSVSWNGISFWKDLFRRLHHRPESSILFSVRNCSRGVPYAVHSRANMQLNWDDRGRSCEDVHNQTFRRPLFGSMRGS
jgi:hypothetical protein